MSDNFSSYLTPISKEYSACESCRASLLVYTGKISPHIVTNLLNIEPTEIAITGVNRKFPSGVIKPSHLSYWFLHSENQIESKDLRDHIDLILNMLNSVPNELKKLQAISGISMYIKCYWISKSGESGPVLWPQQMKLLAKLNLECSIGFSFFGDDDE